MFFFLVAWLLHWVWNWYEWILSTRNGLCMTPVEVPFGVHQNPLGARSANSCCWCLWPSPQCKFFPAGAPLRFHVPDFSLFSLLFLAVSPFCRGTFFSTLAARGPTVAIRLGKKGSRTRWKPWPAAKWSMTGRSKRCASRQGKREKTGAINQHVALNRPL